MQFKTSLGRKRESDNIGRTSTIMSSTMMSRGINSNPQAQRMTIDEEEEENVSHSNRILQLENELIRVTNAQANNDRAQQVLEERMNSTKVTDTARLLFKVNALHMIESYKCKFCEELGIDGRGHLVNKCPIKLGIDQRCKKDPVLAMQWGKLKYAKIDLDAKKAKLEYIQEKNRIKEELHNYNNVKLKRGQLKECTLTSQINKLALRSSTENYDLDFDLPIVNPFVDNNRHLNESNNGRVFGDSEHVWPAEYQSDLNKGVVYARTNTTLRDGDSCVICLEKIRGGISCCELSCSHHFHHECMIKFFDGNNSCPVCKRGVANVSGYLDLARLYS